MAIQDRTRHDRLRKLLPRNYAVEAQTSALGVVLEVLADELCAADVAIERALRDKWLATSAGPRRALEVAVPSGWVIDEQLPAMLREAAQADAATLGLRVARVLSPEPKATIRALSQSARVLVAERLLAPASADFVDEDSMLARLQQLLAPLSIPTLAQAPVATQLVVEGEAPEDPEQADTRSKRLWARWLIPGEALEAVIAPAGAFIAVIVLRGPADESSYREGFDALLRDSLGFSGVGSPTLPTVSMARPPEPLEQLGAALELRRQPWETDAETYRNRVRLLAPMLTEGLATTRVMLAAVLSSLHSEPCPIIEQPEADSTRGFGLPPKTLARCPVCKGGGTPPPGSECPRRAQATMQATVTDNPRTRAKLIRSRLVPSADPEGAGAGGGLRVRNDSLFSARPEIYLSVPEVSADVPAETRVVPSFRSLTTGDEVVVPAVLRPGDQLTLRPKSSYDPALPRRQQYWVDPPAGEALLPARAWIRRAGGGFEDVGVILFAGGPRFDQTRFANAAEPALYDQAHWDNAYLDEEQAPASPSTTSFAHTQQLTTSPELRPGHNDWLYMPLSKAQLSSLITDYAVSAEDLGIDLEPDFDPALVKVALELRWWTRPPARFRVRVPLVPAVTAAVGAGAATYMRSMVERVRPAGVHPIIDFALEPFSEQLDPAVDTAALELRGFAEVAPEHGLDLALSQAEVVDPDDQMAFIGVFNVTHFDLSLLTDQGADPGQFDVTRFDHSLLHPFEGELGMFNQSFLDQATFTDDPLGEWDGVAGFDGAVFS